MIKPRILFKELRAEFLPASVMPVLLGTAIAHLRTGVFDPVIFSLALAGIVLIHLGTNVANDYFDHISGNDPLNTQFVRPFTGGSRLIQDGLLTQRAVLIIAIALFAAAVAAGAALTALRGPVVLLLGAIGLGSGFFYTAPPVNLASRGFGEVFIGLNFGVLPTAGAYYIQTRSMSWESVVASLPLAVLIAAVVFINEFQDMNADARTGKRTLVVRLGLSKASKVFALFMIAPFAAVLIGVAARIVPPLALISLAAAPFAARAALVARAKHSSPKELAPANALTVVTHTLVGILLAAAYLISR